MKKPKRDEWRQPTPIMQLRAFTMRLEGEDTICELRKWDLATYRQRIAERCEELSELLEWIEHPEGWTLPNKTEKTS